MCCFRVVRDDGLDTRKCTLHIKQCYGQVKQGSCADPVGGGGGGGGVETRRPENSLDNVFLSHQLILQFTEWIQWFYYRGEKGIQLLPGDGGVKRNPNNL